MTNRREFIQSLPAAGAVFALAAQFGAEESASAQSTSTPADGHFHPRGKAPSRHTLEILRQAERDLPFHDRRDFEELQKGLIAEIPQRKVLNDDGEVVWDIDRHKFLLDADGYDSIHPSMMRQAKLNMNYGLYEVMPGIYQVRGIDMSDISFVRGQKGWIAIDPLVSREVARVALDLFQKHVGKGDPITAVIYSHSHVDHWGGVRGIVDEADVRAGKVEIIAPRDFMDYTIAENVYAGNAMNRRIQYQYGFNLPPSPYGHAGNGLGTTASTGVTGLIAPTRVIEEDIEYLTVDGVSMVFQNTPYTEAPSEMNTYFPEMKALFMAENINPLLHNIYTLRGALIRDALRWSQYINEALYLFGKEAEVMFTAHGWPRWGKARIEEVMRGQRDLYAHMNNQVLHLANSGVTINEIHNVYELPASLQQKWFCRGYHGSQQHNSRGVVNRFLGYWDCNPATLIPMSPRDSAPLYVEMMGGARPILSKGRELHDAGRYFEAQEILNRLVQAEPGNREAKELLADVFEQLGYQQETPGLRLSYLSAAQELRDGVSTGLPVKTGGPDVVRAMSTQLFLNFLGIRMDSRKAEELEFTINLITPDNGEKFVIELGNATLTNIQGYLADDAELTLTINRADLEQTMMGAKTLEAQIADGTAKVEGDLSVLQKLGATMVDFDPSFEIMPGTKGDGDVVVTHAGDYEAVPGAPCVE